MIISDPSQNLVPANALNNTWCADYSTTHKVYTYSSKNLENLPKIIFLAQRDRLDYPTNEDSEKNNKVIHDRLFKDAIVLIESKNKEIDRAALQLDFIEDPNQVKSWDDPEARKLTAFFKDEVDARVLRIESYIENSKKELQEQIAQDLIFLERELEIPGLTSMTDMAEQLDLIYEKSVEIYCQRVRLTAMQRAKTLLQVIEQNGNAPTLFVNLGLNHVFYKDYIQKKGKKKAPEWTKDIIQFMQDGLSRLNYSYVILKPKKHKN